MQTFANLSGTLCPYCDSKLNSNKFEIVEDRPANSDSSAKFAYLRCTTCKKFLAIMPYNAIGTLFRTS